MPPSTVRTRILILSDTHSGRNATTDFSSTGAFRPPLPPADVVLHTGDLTMVGTMPENLAAFDLLSSLPAPLKLVIAGNHDLTLHESYYLSHRNPATGTLYAQNWAGAAYDVDAPTQALALWTGEKAKAAGVQYLTEGIHELTLPNGARLRLYASPWQPQFCKMAFNYPHHEDRWNPPHLVAPGATPAPQERDPHPLPEGAEVDVVMTHGPAKGHLDRCVPSGVQAGCPHLLRALERVRPRLFCCGHIHEGWGAERVAWRSGEEPRPEGFPTGKLGETTQILASSNQDDADAKSVIRPTDPDVVERRAAYVDLTADGGKPLREGLETLFINSCVVDTEYIADNAAWLVDLDLPRAKDDE